MNLSQIIYAVSCLKYWCYSHAQSFERKLAAIDRIGEHGLLMDFGSK